MNEHDREWYKGQLDWMLRPHGQTWIHDFILNCSLEEDTVNPVVVNAHRRLGKSFLNVLMAIEDCIRKPSTFVKYCCGEKEQVRDIVEPLFMQIMATCPDDLQPRRRGFTYIFNNPRWESKEVSYLKLVGANYKMGDMGRGTACDRAYLDEVRDFKALRYFVQSVLAPQFLGRSAPRLVITSTVPWSMDHDFTRPTSGYIDQAKSANRYIEIPGSKNSDFGERDKKIVLSTLPMGEADISYQREIECKLIGDTSRLICPSYQLFRSELVVNSWTKPAYFYPYMALDTGFDPDATAIIGGYVDYFQQLLIFEGCHVEKRMTTRDIANRTANMEKTLGYDKATYAVRRIADMTEREIADLMREHHLAFQPVVRHDAKSAVASFNSKIEDHQIRLVLPACHDLDYQLLHGYWNEAGSKIERTEGMGHWDAGKAAVYLARQAPWGVNPYPSGSSPEFRSRFLDPRRSTGWSEALRGLWRR